MRQKDRRKPKKKVMAKLAIKTYLLLTLVIMAGCSTTKRLGEDEVLYVGVKSMKIESVSGEEVDPATKSEVKSELSVKPNNPLVSPYWRTPFPLGLLVYNYCEPTKDKGFKHWFYNKFSREPVLISSVAPDLRMKLVESMLDNAGYFNSDASYELLYKKRNDKKARLSYQIDVAKPWVYGEITFPEVTDSLTSMIDRIKDASLLRPGLRYDTDTLQAERVRISTYLRNHGYYFFRPEYIRFLADTTQADYKVMIKAVLQNPLPPNASRQYRIGKIDVYIASATGKGEVDTMQVSGRRRNRRGRAGLTVTYQQPAKVKWQLVRRSITVRSGRLYSLEEQNLSQSNLNRTGVFSYVNTTAVVDSLNPELLNMRFDLAMAKPIEASFEVDVNSKSNSFLGPNMLFSISHNNILGGGEKLSLQLNGSYEWQTGANRASSSSLMNSYEFGATVALTFPRLLIPGFIKEPRRYTRTTDFKLGANLMNRPNYFRIVSFSATMEYNFSTSRYSSHTLNPFKLIYNKLLNTTASFDATLEENPAIALSFRDQFIPMMKYTYNFNKYVGRDAYNRISFKVEATQAGNLLDGIMLAFGKQGPYKFFGNQFSQFVKGEVEFKYFRCLWGDNWLASRLLVGAGHAYGNSSVIPYSEQFYIGGANSIRAFTVRSLGPGSYRPDFDNPNYYFDQTGNFKLEANVELRFKLVGNLHCAVFLDAGNIWLLQDDPARPGGKLQASTFLKDIALGTGFGIRYDLSVIVLRLDLGIGIHAPYDTGKSGYYNMTSFKKSLGLHLAIGYPF